MLVPMMQIGQMSMNMAQTRMCMPPCPFLSLITSFVTRPIEASKIIGDTDSRRKLG